MRKHSYYDYERDVNELRNNDIRYENGDHTCKICGARMKKYIEQIEFQGAIVNKPVWECENPRCGE